ncbi:MAG: hypothetical protein JXR91_14945 [Deltaproteobacteria bacterium]|nr:hypothetical protein [Deltaproteobacteria bacterium]
MSLNDKNTELDIMKKEIYVKPAIEEEDKLTTYTLSCNPPWACAPDTVIATG